MQVKTTQCIFHQILVSVPRPTHMFITMAAGVASTTKALRGMRSTVTKQAVIKMITHHVLSEKEGARTMNSNVSSCYRLWDQAIPVLLSSLFIIIVSEQIPCPSTHPYMYRHGDYCCSQDTEYWGNPPLWYGSANCYKHQYNACPVASKCRDHYTGILITTTMVVAKVKKDRKKATCFRLPCIWLLKASLMYA